MGLGNKLSKLSDSLRYHRTAHTRIIDVLVNEDAEALVKGAEIRLKAPVFDSSSRGFNSELYDMVIEACRVGYFQARPIGGKVARLVSEVPITADFINRNKESYVVELLPSGILVASPAYSTLVVCVHAGFSQPTKTGK